MITTAREVYTNFPYIRRMLLHDKMSEIIINRVKQSIGKYVTIFLKNGFRYEGKITNCDEDYVEVLEEKHGLKIIQLIDISEINIPIGKVGE